MSILSSPWAAALLTGAAGVAQGYTAANEEERKRRAAEREQYGMLDYQRRQQLIDKQNEEQRKQSDPLYQAQLGAAQGAADLAQGKGPVWEAKRADIDADNARADKTVSEHLKERAEQTARQAEQDKRAANAEERRVAQEAKQDAKDRVLASKQIGERALLVQMYNEASLLSDELTIDGKPSPRSQQMDEVRKYAVSAGEIDTFLGLKQGKQQTPGAAPQTPNAAGSVFDYQIPPLGAASGAPTAQPAVPPPGQVVQLGKPVPTGERANPLSWNQDLSQPPAVVPPPPAPGAAARDPAQRATAKATAMAPPPNGWGYSEAQAEQWLTSSGW